MKLSEIIGIPIALILTAVGIIFGQSFTGAYILIVLAAGLLIIIFLYNVNIKRKKLEPTPYDKEEDVRNASKSIYKMAARKGGTLISTHVLTRTIQPKDDYAVRLLAEVDRRLEFKRYIFIDDVKMEDKWIQTGFESIDKKNVITSFHFLFPQKVMLNTYHKRIPRVNMLLYKSEDLEYYCLIGFDRLRSNDPQYQNVNYAVEFHDEATYNILSRYFDSMIAFSDVISAQSWSNYYEIIQPVDRQRKLHWTIQQLFQFGSTESSIEYLGVFGSIATYLNGLCDIRDTIEHEADIDVFIVIQRGEMDTIKNMIINKFQSEDVEIIWGDDPTYFYKFRSPRKITIDIEIHEKDTEYYILHKLLGCSIFSNIYMLYQKEASLDALLTIPDNFTSEQRYLLLMNDRKGLLEFKTKMIKPSQKIDPRRIVALCIKNISWAISGSRPLNTSLAIGFLSPYWDDIFPSISLHECRDFLLTNQDEVRNNYAQFQQATIDFISDAIKYIEKESNRPS